MPALDSTRVEETEPDLLPFALNRLMAAWNARLAARLEARGTTFPQWRVLMVASRAEGTLTIVELAERTLVPHSTLSRQIAAMERAGLVRREPAEHDARAVRVVLTPKGRARYREVLPLALDETESGLAPLSKAERATLARLVTRLSETTR